MNAPRTVRSTAKLIRPLVRHLRAYVPGEQPKIRGLIKLNTNENPYPPSPKVLRAIKAAVDGRLRLYPNPTADPLRQRLARLHGCRPGNLIVGNGSDELLALATRAFVEPLTPGRRDGSKPPSTSVIQFFTPSYSLYPVLADIHGTAQNAVPLAPDFGLPALLTSARVSRPPSPPACAKALAGRRPFPQPVEGKRGSGVGERETGRRAPSPVGLLLNPAIRAQRRDLRTSEPAWNPAAALTFVTTPNAPSGRAYPTSELEALCRGMRGVVLLDEAYVDFAEENALALALKYPHVIVTRTFSKAYSLCFQRVGYAIGHPDLIAAMHKIKDSYNVNGLGQVAALATLEHLAYYRAGFQRIRTTRERLRRALADLGFEVLPSQTNFLLTRPPRFPAERWLRQLRERRILVRWFSSPAMRDYLRISIGSEAETDALLEAVRAIRGG